MQMDPGYGKTYLGVGLIERVGRRAVVIVPNTYLLRQWVGILKEAFPRNVIGCYYGVRKVDGDVVVAVVNSALTYGGWGRCGLVIYDEVHMYCSAKFKEVFGVAQAARCLGITATPSERIDRFDPVAHWALGKVVRADGVEGWDAAAIEFTARVVKVEYGGPAEYTEVIESKMGVVSVPLMVNQLVGDPYRNAVVVAYAARLCREGRNVFVFSDRREHLHVLAALLRGVDVGVEAPELEGVEELMGGASDREIEDAKVRGRVILTTYAYTAVGVSINKMDALILATPRKSNMRQILGRIFRLGSDQGIRRDIVDVVDVRVCLKSQYYTRKKEYARLGAEVSTHKVGWEGATVEGVYVEIRY